MSAGDVQARVQAIIDHRVASADEVGVQVAVVEHGQVVVDAVSASADPSQSKAVGSDTLFWAASTAKGVASAVAHVLVERGELAYDLRAVEVWPEFGAHGKDRITLRHVLLHTAGVPAPPYDTTVEQLCNWEHMCMVLAEAEPGGSLAAASATTPRPSASCSARSCGERRAGPRRGGCARWSPSRSGSGTRSISGCPRSWWTRWPASSHRSDRHPRRQSRDRRSTGRSLPASGPTPTTPIVGSAAYADTDTAVAVAVMRSRFDTDLTAVSEIDRIVADVCPSGCSQPDLRRKE